MMLNKFELALVGICQICSWPVGGLIPSDRREVGEHVEQVAAAAPSTSDWRMVLYHDRNVAGRRTFKNAPCSFPGGKQTSRAIFHVTERC